MEQNDPGQTNTQGSRAALAQALADAQLYIDFACRQGKSPDKSAIASVLVFRERFEAGSWSTDEQAEFWIGLEQLARAVQPATAASIRSLASRRQVPIVRKYTVSALATLLLIIVLQGYLFITQNIVESIDKTSADIERMLTDKVVMDSIREEEARIPDNHHLICQQLLVQYAENGLECSMEWLAFKKTLEKTSNHLAKRIDRAKVGTIGSFYTLYRMDPLTSVPESLEKAFAAKALDLNNTPLKKTPAWNFYENSTHVNQQMMRQLQSINATIVQFVLPLLFGLLGSLAYILRTLNHQIRETTFREGDNTAFTLRWPLGMLAGITVGWFIDPNTVEGFAILPPIALAFLAGYSVELVFAGMDRFVGAFTQTKDR